MAKIIRGMELNKAGYMVNPVACGRAGRDSDRKDHLGRSSELKKLKNAEKVNSRKSVRWSAVPVAPKLVWS